MKSEITLIPHSVTTEQIDAFKAFGKAMKVKVNINKKSKKDNISNKKQKLLKSLERSFRDIKLIKEGKLKTRPAKEVLNEI